MSHLPAPALDDPPQSLTRGIRICTPQLAAPYEIPWPNHLYSPANAAAFVRRWYGYPDRERFCILPLDASHRWTMAINLAFGGTIAAQLRLQEVLRAVVLAYTRQVVLIRSADEPEPRRRATTVRGWGSAPEPLVIVHNHLNDDPRPTAFDRRFTQDLVRAMAVIGMSLYDHLIIGNYDGHLSMRDAGLLG